MLWTAEMHHIQFTTHTHMLWCMCTYKYIIKWNKHANMLAMLAKHASHMCLLFRLAWCYWFRMHTRWLMSFFVHVCRYRHTVSLGSMAVMCQFCKPPQALEASKGCADCRSNFCNECFKLYHPWGTPRAQHEHILPTHNFRPKVKINTNVPRTVHKERESLSQNINSCVDIQVPLFSPPSSVLKKLTSHIHYH